MAPGRVVAPLTPKGGAAEKCVLAGGMYMAAMASTVSGETPVKPETVAEDRSGRVTGGCSVASALGALESAPALGLERYGFGGAIGIAA